MSDTRHPFAGLGPLYRHIALQLAREQNNKLEAAKTAKNDKDNSNGHQ